MWAPCRPFSIVQSWTSISESEMFLGPTSRVCTQGCPKASTQNNQLVLVLLMVFDGMGPIISDPYPQNFIEFSSWKLASFGGKWLCTSQNNDAQRYFQVEPWGNVFLVNGVSDHCLEKAMVMLQSMLFSNNCLLGLVQWNWSETGLLPLGFYQAQTFNSTINLH